MITKEIFDSFKGKGTFTLTQAYKKFPHLKKESIRARIYEHLDKFFVRISRSVYLAIEEDVVLLEGDGRDLSMLLDNSIDMILTDHPWKMKKSNKGGNRCFANYDSFLYTQSDFNEKARVLKEGSFLVEIIPAENESNYEYLYSLKKMANIAGFSYYAKVTWKKGSFVSNTGRKAKNSEEILIFSKGKARSLRLDAKAFLRGDTRYISGSNKMLPTHFDVQPPSRKEQIWQTEKPIQLLEQILDFLSKEGEIVLDQFAGSGSTGCACRNKKRKAILIEKSLAAIEIIKNRLSLQPIIKEDLLCV